MKARQAGKCRHCDVKLTKNFEVDHAVPLCEGGTNDKTNLQLLCKRCRDNKTQEEAANRG